MNEKEFTALVKKTVADYANRHLDKADGVQITEDNVFVVWMCKTLQNNKALASTTLFDGMYYELTYNGDKNEMYVDAYKKFENYCVKLGDPAEAEQDIEDIPGCIVALVPRKTK